MGLKKHRKKQEVYKKMMSLLLICIFHRIPLFELKTGEWQFFIISVVWRMGGMTRTEIRCSRSVRWIVHTGHKLPSNKNTESKGTQEGGGELEIRGINTRALVISARFWQKHYMTTQAMRSF